MAATRIGILSDTHLSRPSEHFDAQLHRCFSDIEVVLHAGDLTNPAILGSLQDKEVIAVHGNMCDSSSRSRFPAVHRLELQGFTIVLTHGHRYGYRDIEDRLYLEFAEADCIIYGHTHKPVCHESGNILFINPGTFLPSGRFGSPGTYAVLEVGAGLSGQILQVPAST